MLEACGAIDDPDLELRRQGHRARVGERLALDRQREVLDDIGEWARTTNVPRAKMNHTTWSAGLRLREGRYAEAAALFENAAAEQERAPARMAGFLNAGTTYLRIGEFERASHMAEQALDLAVRYRHPLYEAYAESLRRDILYRTGDAHGTDREFIDAIAEIGSPGIEGYVALTEAATGWRSGQTDVARELATRAATLFSTLGDRAAYLLARGLEVECGDTLPSSELRKLVAEALDQSDHTAAIQFLGLVAPHGGKHRKAVGDALDQIVTNVPAERRDLSLEVMSVNEAMARAVPG